MPEAGIAVAGGVAALLHDVPDGLCGLSVDLGYPAIGEGEGVEQFPRGVAWRLLLRGCFLLRGVGLLSRARWIGPSCSGICRVCRRARGALCRRWGRRRLGGRSRRCCLRRLRRGGLCRLGLWARVLFSQGFLLSIRGHRRRSHPHRWHEVVFGRLGQLRCADRGVLHGKLQVLERQVVAQRQFAGDLTLH